VVAWFPDGRLWPSPAPWLSRDGRCHEDYWLEARSPAQASMEALGVDEITAIIPTEEFIEPLPTAA